jgi:hypothetical protein
LNIAGVYSFNRGVEVIKEKYPDLLKEVEAAVAAVDASRYRTKKSVEKTMRGRMLYSPRALNKAFKAAFKKAGGWTSVRVPCDYSTEHYAEGYEHAKTGRGAFREMDFLKRKLGIEIQFGKYAFMVYNVCAKMTIFHNLGHIDHGIEIVPVGGFAEHMSSGVSYFEQFVWDLDKRGVANIDIPVMILGIDK